MTTTSHDLAQLALAEARFILINAKWKLCQEQALARLAHQRGLACTPLFPEHPVIQVVAFDGRLLGRVRLHRDGRKTSWIATRPPLAHQVGAHRSLGAAARALAQAAGLPHRRRLARLPGTAPVALDGRHDSGRRQRER
ncbi:hypothetical protein [Kitasatospora sp. NPDC098663]|uniref:hypothetical protein n=1 Tax=Kitasatospora sp. NPDC098663 TaxID=3364096 RepID=UPI003825A386